MVAQKPSLKILLAAPRGFCAGVDRAIQIVQVALQKFGSPVYVRHEIVHNRFVVDSLKKKGAIFVDELDQVPAGAPVVFSAHGVPKSVPVDAQNRKMIAIDATCPLVSKVHRDAERHHADGRHIILIGHKGHPEVIGTMGQIPADAITLIENVADVSNLNFDMSLPLAYCTQTTLSIDDTAQIIEALKLRYPHIIGPNKQDICYATTNRQNAVREIASRVDALFVLGAPNSSNSRRLVEAAKQNGCPRAFLIERAIDIDWSVFENISSVGITAGASAPEVLVEEVISVLQERFDVTINNVEVTKENIAFNLPMILREEQVA